MASELTTQNPNEVKAKMSSQNTPVMQTRASVVEWLLTNCCDYVGGTTDYEFTHVIWCTDIINEKMCLLVPQEYSEEQGFHGGFCLGVITDVRLNHTMMGGEKMVNLTVILQFFALFLKSQNSKIPKRNAEYLKKIACVVFYYPYTFKRFIFANFIAKCIYVLVILMYCCLYFIMYKLK
jgi:hypothetical protein